MTGRHSMSLSFIYDMHLHAYNKANYQTHVQTPHAVLHKSYLALVLRKWSSAEEWKKWRRRRRVGWGGAQHVASAAEPNRPGSDYDSRCFLLTYLIERLTWADSEANWAEKRSFRSRNRLHVCSAAPSGKDKLGSQDNQTIRGQRSRGGS